MSKHKRTDVAKAASHSVPCDVNHCPTPWCIVVNVRDNTNTVKHTVKLCAPHYKEFQAGKSPELRG